MTYVLGMTVLLILGVTVLLVAWVVMGGVITAVPWLAGWGVGAVVGAIAAGLIFGDAAIGWGIFGGVVATIVIQVCISLRSP